MHFVSTISDLVCMLSCPVAAYLCMHYITVNIPRVSTLLHFSSSLLSLSWLLFNNIWETMWSSKQFKRFYLKESQVNFFSCRWGFPLPPTNANFPTACNCNTTKRSLVKHTPPPPHCFGPLKYSLGMGEGGSPNFLSLSMIFYVN